MEPFRNKKEAIAYKKRWKQVNDFEIKELLKSSPSKKLEQLAALMSSVKEMGWEQKLKKEESIVRKRWILLRTLCHV